MTFLLGLLLGFIIGCIVILDTEGDPLDEYGNCYHCGCNGICGYETVGENTDGE